ncbi:hypothetical protein NMY22_g12888 [Coprinellus aureogranulatus]|nr:hypothetical protein NMY22_g12888 [Coprinellus aureogranulatus]
MAQELGANRPVSFLHSSSISLYKLVLYRASGKRLTLVSHTRSGASMNSRESAENKAVTGIHSLPVELLNKIFEEVYHDWLLFALHPELYSSQPVSLRSRSWQGLMRLLLQFPYTPTAVCRLWREVISSNPKFWTRAVAFVDTKDPLSTLSNLRRILEYSQGLPITVAVVRKNYNIRYDKEESMNVSLYMDILLANLHRFQDMYFHLNQSSSLPSILHFVKQNRPPTLDRLALHCDIDDGENVDVKVDGTSVRVDLRASALTTLKVDGRNLISICHSPSLWSSIFVKLRCLTIERLQPSELHRENLSLTSTIDFLSKLPNLEVLTIRDVVFEETPRASGVQTPTITVSDLILEDLSDGVVKSLFDHATIAPTYHAHAQHTDRRATPDPAASLP